MQKIIIKINSSIYEHIMLFLQSLPKNLIDIQIPNKNSIPSKASTKAFGILKGKIKDPVEWQREIREDRDIYRDAH